MSDNFGKINLSHLLSQQNKNAIHRDGCSPFPSERFVSIPCQGFRCVSRNKTNTDIKEIDKNIQKIVFNDEKFRLLKENTRNAGVITNKAIIQHLLMHGACHNLVQRRSDNGISN